MSNTLTVKELKELLKDVPEDYSVFSNPINKAMGVEDIYWASCFRDRRYVNHKEKAVILVRSIE